MKATDLITHTINLTSNASVKAKRFRNPPALDEALQAQIDSLVKKGVLAPSTSEYSSPTWVIKKHTKPGETPNYRLITDFRMLNQITQGSNYPIPIQTDIIDNVASARYITCLDLQSGYYQIKLDKKSRTYTAFSGPRGHYEYLRVPMGLKTSSHRFMSLMFLVLNGLIGKDGIWLYLDDIILTANSLSQHLTRFNKLAERLEIANLTLNPKKCQFLQREARVLGHIVGNNSIKMCPSKLAAVQKYPVPTSQKKCKQFTSFCSYYRRFIKGFAKIARPLYQLQHDNVPFIWGPKEQESFETLKNMLCSEPVLAAPNFDKPFVISCDASDYAVGCILETESEGKMHPCAYASRTLRGPELRYSAYDKELTAIVYACNQFYYYIYGRHFKVITDHLPLKHLFSTKKPDPRFNRLKTELQGLDLEIIYRKGTSNPADALSRNPVIENGEINPEKPRSELYALADAQEKVEPQANVFTFKRTRNQRRRENFSDSETEKQVPKKYKKKN